MGSFRCIRGGQERAIRNQYGYADGRWQCGQVNILIALTDINPGDGGTRVIPGSHKGNIAHPVFRQPYSERCKLEDEVVEGAIEVTLKAGSALLFSDAIAHGATRRTNPGQRRLVIYRYGPGWGNTRYGYRYAQDLLDRVTAAQRAILQPVLPRVPGAALGLQRG